MSNSNLPEPGFFARLQIAFSCFTRALSDASFARRANGLLSGPVESVKTEPAAKAAVEVAPERSQAPALAMLAMFQREGRLIDFLQDNVAEYSDADVGAAARVVHAGCRKALAQCLTLEPVLRDGEGATVQVPAGFDAQRIRLTGNVAGQPPFRGALRHQGWVATQLRFPSLSPQLDPRVVAPAEVEI